MKLLYYYYYYYYILNSSTKNLDAKTFFIYTYISSSNKYIYFMLIEKLA